MASTGRMRSGGVRAPRHDRVDPQRLQSGLPGGSLDAPAGPADLRPGDVLERRDVGDLDVGGRVLTELDIEECAIGVLRADAADLRGLRIRDATIGVLDTPVLRAPGSIWRGVRVAAGRVGSVELHDAVLDDVRIVGAKLGFVDLRTSTIRDVTFEDCVIDELDLGSAQLERIAFPGCRIRELTASGARLRDVDLRGADISVIADAAQLRGAVLDREQVLAMAAALARAVGIVVED
ncbi:pentapeptide repeat-containing protein [Curtobacterium sp. RRHDQ10]|uniref:pentapeptide repeat-containing protein n=1 Tax=Curtobacterium phyllosphaerae TaxID=3413379 RepID=UPI003BEF68EA